MGGGRKGGGKGKGVKKAQARTKAVKARMSDQAQQYVVEATKEESEPPGAWLYGPYTATEITDMLGPHWLPIRRFAIDQGGKRD